METQAGEVMSDESSVRALYAAIPTVVEAVKILMRDCRTQPIAGLVVVKLMPSGAHEAMWAGEMTVCEQIGALEMAKYQISLAGAEQADDEPQGSA